MFRRSVAVLVFVFSAASSVQAQRDEWSVYGHDAHGTRYSTLTQINRSNISRLHVAWTYSTGEDSLPVSMQDRYSLETTPIVVDGVMYISTPIGRVIGL